MSVGIIGKKCGMTRLFLEGGAVIPVTVIEATPNRVTQIKTLENDGYQAIQVTYGDRRPHHVNKALGGHYTVAGVEAGRSLYEFRLSSKESISFRVGDEIRIDVFSPGQKVDVTGITKGKGFAGVIKRHHFSSQDASHGNSLSHRAPGSIGQNQSPGRVYLGKRMAGHLGCTRRTIQNLEIAGVYLERNVLLVKGAIPGSLGEEVVVQSAIKVVGPSLGK
jgi:large subunit ribosomal protein L3